MLASASDPLLKDLHIDLLSIIHMFVSNGLDSCSSVILQQEETKIMVLDTNLLGNVDSSFSPSESDTFNWGWSISFIIYWKVGVYIGTMKLVIVNIVPVVVGQCGSVVSTMVKCTAGARPIPMTWLCH